MRASRMNVRTKSGRSTRRTILARKSWRTSTSNWTDAQTDRINKDAVYQLAQAKNYDAIAAVRESVVIQDILKQESLLSAQYTDAVNQYGPKYPKVIRLQEQLKDLDQLIAREKNNIVNQVEAQYHGSRQRELLLQQALDQQKTETNRMAEKLVQYNILKREADTNKQLYDGMLQKLKEAGITAGLRSSNIRVVDPALIPTGLRVRTRRETSC